MPFAPIWKDRIVTLAAGADSADFEIHVGSAAGELIYSGRAYARPGAADVVARINDICADYLASTLPASSFPPPSARIAETFVTVVGGSAVDTVTFVADWSYDPLRTITASTPLSDPILPELDPRQPFLVSYLGTPGSVTLTFQDGTTQTVDLTTAGSYNQSFNSSFAVGSGSGPATAVLDLATYDGLASLTFNGITWKVAENCSRFLVAYFNAFGGWDTLVLDGIPVRRDDLVRHTIDTDYDNTDPTARGRRDYAIEVSPAWTLRTGILTDAQSEKMHHLLNSPDVYLLDFADMVWRPVVLTDTTHDEQTYRSNGRRPAVYEFNAQLAQERFRR